MKRKSTIGISSVPLKSAGYLVDEKNIKTDKATAVLPVLFEFSTCVNLTTVDTVKPSDFYYQNKNRLTSEWKTYRRCDF